MTSTLELPGLMKEDITRFYEALKLLEEQQGFYSHPYWYNSAYETICNMGRKILPLIYLNLHEADKEYGNEKEFYLSGHWHAALHRLTGREVGHDSIRNPRGGGFVRYNIQGLKDDWLEWLETQDEIVSSVTNLV